MAYYQTDEGWERAAMRESPNEDFTVYVNNLPEELNEDGIKEIFKHYGKICGYFHRPNASWAYINYTTYGEAEAAIRDLNNAPPLRLKVSLAKEKKTYKLPIVNTNAPMAVNSQYENLNDVHATAPLRKPNVPVNDLRKIKATIKKMNLGPEFGSNTYTTDDDLLYPYPSDPHTYNPYEKEDAYESSNALWTRGQLTITKDGKRHVTLGRGYTLYEIPQPDPEVQEHLCRVYERRSAGLYEYGKDMLDNAIGTCLKCSKVTKFMCKRCHGFYCSTICQVADWPKHKTECQPIPELVPATNGMSFSEPKQQEYHTIRAAPITPMTLRRPKKFDAPANNNATSKGTDNVADLSGCANKDNSTSGSKFSSTNAIKQNRAPKSSPEETVANDKAKEIHHGSNRNDTAHEVNMEYKSNVSEHKMQSGLLHRAKSNTSIAKKSDSVEETHKKRPNINTNDAMKMEQDIAFENKSFLPKTEYKDMKIVVKTSDREYYVQNLENDEMLTNLMIELQSVAATANKVKPIIGHVYGVQFEDIWHRASVVSTNPLRVQYIDYGNEEPIATDDFRYIDKLQDIPQFARKIRLSQRADSKYKDIAFEVVLPMKLLSVDPHGVLNVEVRGENDLPTSKSCSVCETSRPAPVEPPVQPPVHTPVQAALKPPVKSEEPQLVPDLKNVISTLAEGEEGILEVHVELSNNTYSITLLPSKLAADYEEVLCSLPETCTQLMKTTKYSPRIGDLICGQRLDGDWLRGYILAVETPLKMAIIDEGRMMEIGHSLPCPPQYSKICAFGAKCKILDAKHVIKASEQHVFKVVSCKHDQSEVEVEITKEDETKMKALLRPWIPVPEQKGVRIAELRSGTEVCLTAFRSHNLLFAQSLESSEVERCNNIIQSVSKCAQTAPLLNEPPVVGQMVIAPYIDHNYYRAIVTKVQKSQAIISYVDFGNMEIANINKLKVLSDDIKQFQSCTAKITLKDVPRDVAMTKDVSDYLSYLTGREIPLLCTFDGLPSKDGVVLKTRDGKCVNDKVKELLQHTWEKDNEDDKMVYLMHHLLIAKLGNVDEVVPAVVLNSVKAGHNYMMCPLDDDLIKHVFETMHDLIEKFCKTTEFYIPRDTELCLVLYRGSVWSRAVCLTRNQTPSTSSVFLVDLGIIDTVNHKDMRLMPKDFMTPTALASVCTVINLAPTDSNGEYSTKVTDRISKLMVTLKDVVQVKIVAAGEEDGLYTIELPEIRAQLIAEGLVPA